MKTTTFLSASVATLALALVGVQQTNSVTPCDGCLTPEQRALLGRLRLVMEPDPTGVLRPEIQVVDCNLRLTTTDEAQHTANLILSGSSQDGASPAAGVAPAPRGSFNLVVGPGVVEESDYCISQALGESRIADSSFCTLLSTGNGTISGAEASLIAASKEASIEVGSLFTDRTDTCSILSSVEARIQSHPTSAYRRVSLICCTNEAFDFLLDSPSSFTGSSCSVGGVANELTGSSYSFGGQGHEGNGVFLGGQFNHGDGSDDVLVGGIRNVVGTGGNNAVLVGGLDNAVGTGSSNVLVGGQLGTIADDNLFSVRIGGLARTLPANREHDIQIGSRLIED